MATPGLRMHILDGLCERPEVACQVSCGVLPLPEGLISRSAEDVRARGDGSVVVRVDIVDAHHR